MLILLETMAEESRELTASTALEPLLAGIAAGEQESLAELYRRGRTAVYGLALSYLKNAHDAEDVTQDTFVRVWEHAGQYQSRGTPLAWVLTIAKNLSLMKLRERGRVKEMEPEEWEHLAAENPMVTVEDRQVLGAALSALSDQERQVVMLHAVTGLKHKEIAALLEMPLATVLSKYRRALAKLRDRLERGDAL